VNDQTQAASLDAADPLAGFRDEFLVPQTGGRNQVYFCGHSLGLQPRAAAQAVQDELASWQRLAVQGHFSGPHPWASYAELLAPALAKLLGAHTDEVVAMNSLTVNLHLLMAGFYRPTAERFKILIEGAAFPSDRYAAAAQLRWHGYDPDAGLLQVTPRPGQALLAEQDIHESLERHGHKIALVLLPGVQYLTGQCFNLIEIAAHARRQGCAVGFDLAHAIGNVPLAVHDSGADFAVWCNYKYLNGGPGAIGGAFVHRRHARNFQLPRLAGWWGHDAAQRFAMPEAFAPMDGAMGWQLSNPPILSMAPLRASLQIFERSGMPELRRKSLALTQFLADCLARHLARHVTVVTPSDPAARGAQLSLRFNLDTAAAKTVHRQLLERGIVCDWREPNIMRVAPVPLYNTFTDVWSLTAALRDLVETRP
jgi:kynureninase